MLKYLFARRTALSLLLLHWIFYIAGYVVGLKSWNGSVANITDSEEICYGSGVFY